MNPKRFFLLICFTTALTFDSDGQWFSKDTNEEDIKQKVDHLYDVAWSHLVQNPDSTLYYAQKQKELAQKIGYDLGLVNAYYAIGRAYHNKLYFDVAALNYFNGLDIIKEKTAPKLLKKKLYLYQCLGIVYYKTYQYDHSIEYYQKALQIAEDLDLRKAMGDLYFNIALDYRKPNNLDIAYDFYLKSLNVSKKTGDKHTTAKAYNSIGVLYRDKKQYDLAKENYLKAIEFAKGVPGAERDLLLFKINLGENYFKQNQNALAKKIYFETLEESKKHKDLEKVKLIYNNLGDVFQQENDLAKAIAYYEKSIALGNPEVIDEYVQYAYKKLSLVYEKLGNYRQASHCKSGYIAQADKIISIKQDLTEQNAQYRMKELDWQRQLTAKETLLASAEKENLWGKIIIGAAILLILLCLRYIFVYYRIILRARKAVNSYSDIDWLL